MKLTSVDLHPHGSSEILEMSFRDPRRQNAFDVRRITGLDADEIRARYYGGAGGSEGFYNLVQNKREPTFSIGLNPRVSLGESYSSLRDQIYRSIASSRSGRIHIHFKNGSTIVAETYGFVSKVETSLFEKSQQVDVTVTCKDALLRAPEAVEVNVVGLDPADTLINDPLSTSPHGFGFQLELTANLASMVIGDPNDDSWSFTVTPAGGFLTGDVLHFSSEHNDKKLYLVRGGVTTHLGDKIASGSIWPVLFPGDNTFSVTDSTKVEWLSITHYPAYWGV